MPPWVETAKAQAQSLSRKKLLWFYAPLNVGAEIAATALTTFISLFMDEFISVWKF